ncbi:MAG: pilus assembly protein [Bryobacterales bacterium]|nr:pilus assembly protein [Bryobacterales bacterium]
MTRRGQGGGVLLETALWMPFLILLLMGTVELSRVTYTYYTLKKILYTVARTAGTQGASISAIPPMRKWPPSRRWPSPAMRMAPESRCCRV